MTETYQPPAKRPKYKKAIEDEDSGDPSDEAYEHDENLIDGDLASIHKNTDLETALIPIETSEEAIKQYKAIHTAEELPADLKSRLSHKSWTRGENSIYVDAFNLALGTVLEHEGHLFDQNELEVFTQWRKLDFQAQYLYVRLFLRKMSAWHRINALKYYEDISDISAAIKALQRSRTLEKPSTACQANLSEAYTLEGTVLESAFTFADSSETMITTMEVASSLLTLEELKSISKEARVKGKNKADLLKALLKMSQHQSGLEWVDKKKSDSELVGSTNLCRTNEKIMAITGPCIRLSLPAFKLFERVHLVFYRSSEWTNKSLTTSILAQLSRRNFPKYVVFRSSNVFRSRSDLMEFEAALRLQFEVDRILELNGNSGKRGLEEIISIYEQVYPRWKKLVYEEQKREECLYESGEGAYLRRFSPAWVYTRIIHKGVYVLGHLKNYEQEHAVLTELLGQKLFHPARRGAWYKRKALIEEHYMFQIKTLQGMSNLEELKKHWKRVSLKTCETGLQDKDCHQIYHYDLQKRIQKLERSIKMPKREKHDFGHVLLGKPIEVRCEGIQVIKEYSCNKSNTRSGIDKQRSTKTIWIDEFGGGGECGVEEMCLSSYRLRGYKGFHTEGGIIRTLFAYLFCDIIFTFIPNVFQTEYQICPLDLHTDSFFSSRASDINHRLVEIENGSAAAIIREVDARERDLRTCIIGLNWDFQCSDLLEIVECFDLHALAVICRVLAQEYRVRGSGMPDLFLWNFERKQVVFAEVKSANDRLSETQRLWIHVLTGAGLRVELCNAIARDVRQVMID